MRSNPRESKGALAPGAYVGVIGAGAMGAGIAQVAAQAGHQVLLFDSRAGAAPAAIEGIGAALEKQVAKGRLSIEQARGTSGRLQAVSSMEAFGVCELVLEAVVELLEAKREVFRSLEDVVYPDALLASNTSSLSITAIAADMQRPGRLAGMHFFNPAPLMPLVEVVAGLDTAAETLDILEATALAWGKNPVRARSSPGFIVNRVARPFYAEALRLLDEIAAEPATIDAILRESGGFRMGPFELMDLIGNDVNFAVTCSVFEALHDPRFTPSLRQKELVQAGRFGRKSGKGFYSYAADAPARAPATVGSQPFPNSVVLIGSDALALVLRERLAATGKPFVSGTPEADDVIARTTHAALYRTDGRSATQRASDMQVRDLVLVDLAYDYRSATRLGLTVADQASPVALNEVAGLLQAAGFDVSVLDDAPGMAVMRTVAMLANEAADTVHQGVCTASDCDKAMRLGVNYPQGPLTWADALGPATIASVLDHMASVYGASRYRVSPLMRRKALTGSSFHNHPTKTEDGGND